MERVIHLWNAGRALAKLNCQQARDLQSYYTECCKNLSDQVELPAQRFGPTTMCSHCGLPWGSVERRVKIVPGRMPSRSVRKIIRSTKRLGSSLPKVRKTLMDKCIRNKMNRIVITCSFCSKKTEVRVQKPERVKPAKVQIQKKKRKKKSKDKTAGLNIPGLSTLVQNSGSHRQNPSPASRNTIQSKLTPKTVTPAKPRKLNINKLKDIVNRGVNTQNRKSLQNFLQELY